MANRLLAITKFRCCYRPKTPGITIPNSCRAGLCGACRVKVVSGEVAQEYSPVLSALADDMALACCCVPQTDLVIER